jgi:hypothetical protein
MRPLIARLSHQVSAYQQQPGSSTQRVNQADASLFTEFGDWLTSQGMAELLAAVTNQWRTPQKEISDEDLIDAVHVYLMLDAWQQLPQPSKASPIDQTLLTKYVALFEAMEHQYLS